MLVGLGMIAIFGFEAWFGLSFEEPPKGQYDYVSARNRGLRWSGKAAKYVGVPLGVAIFVFGAVASVVGLF